MLFSTLRRARATRGRHALVDQIPFSMPVESQQSPALMAAFPIDYAKAAALLPGNELHPLRLWRKALLVVTVIDYRQTNIGKYVEFSIAIACTHGKRAAPPLLPGLLPGLFGTGQYVLDLPVSSEISVKGGKGIWGMPKHQANLDFLITDDEVSSQYDLDGQLCMRVSMQRPASAALPVSLPASNYCAFRGMLMKSYIHVRAKAGIKLLNPAAAWLEIGDHPRMAMLHALGIEAPLFAAYMPTSNGTLDDHMESWFISEAQPVTQSAGDGLDSVATLGLDESWLAPPDRSLSGTRYPSLQEASQ